MSKLQRRVTLKDIARETHFSVNTVSKALRNGFDLSSETKQIIKSAAERMGYVINDLAGSLRSGKTKTIALIVGDIINPLFSIIAKDIENQISYKGYTVIIINTEEDMLREEQAVRAAIAKNVDGVLLFPAQHNTKAIELVQHSGIPCVLMGRKFDDLKIDSVLFDDYKGGYIATKHLIERGYKRIMMLNAPTYISSAKQRLLGYKQAHIDMNLSLDPSLHKTISSPLGGDIQMLEAILKDSKYDAIFAFSDLLAFKSVNILTAAGVRMPDDIGIIGFDDIMSRIPFTFPLTSVCVPKSKIASEAVEMLFKRISNDFTDFPSSLVLEVQLTIRKST